jgi:hypothetical protein
MLGNDRRRLELAFSLWFLLPDTPVMPYGDEIGVGDDQALPEPACAHADAVDGQAERRLLAGSGGYPARHRRRVRLPEGQRRGPAAQPALSIELDRADDPGVVGVSADQLGPARGPTYRRLGGVGAALRPAEHVRDLVPMGG